MASMMWDEQVESMDREALRRLQGERLVQQVAYVYAHSKMYRKKFDAIGLKPGDIKGIDDITKLPFTEKQDLRDSQDAEPPFGENLCVPMEEVVWLPSTSGTTGAPVILPRSAADIVTWNDLNARAFTSIGIRRTDIFQHLIQYNWIYGGMALFQGAQAIGAAVINAGPGNTEKQIWALRNLGVTAIHATPTYLVHLGQKLRDLGISEQLNLRVVFGGGEIGTAGPSAKAMLRELYPTAQTIADVGGVTDVGTMIWAECEEEIGGHLAEDSIICEIVDPETLLPVPEGEVGELVFTDLVSTAAPLLRYRVKDLTQIAYEKCGCGRTLARLNPGIIGRSDDMLLVRGANVFPSSIDEIVKREESLNGEYQIIVDRPQALDVMTIRAETRVSGVPAEEKLAISESLASAFKTAFGSKAEIELVEPQTLPSFVYKASRVIDKRRGDTEEAVWAKAAAQK